LRRIKALFPDKQQVLHLFSGRVDLAELPGTTVDCNPEVEPDILDDAQRLEKVPVEHYDLVLADPPYSVEDCDHYQCSMIKRNVVLRALGEQLATGAHVVWLDQVLPMYRKAEFKVIAYIGMVKSTNHRFRVITIFEKC
jgi:16S rRNA G966 N2-methylase RsmD